MRALSRPTGPRDVLTMFAIACAAVTAHETRRQRQPFTSFTPEETKLGRSMRGARHSGSGHPPPVGARRRWQASSSPDERRAGRESTRLSSSKQLEASCELRVREESVQAREPEVTWGSLGLRRPGDGPREASAFSNASPLRESILTSINGS